MSQSKATLCAVVLFTVVIILFGFSSKLITVNVSPTATTFEDMVNASVLLFDDFGHGSGVFISDNIILTTAHCLVGKTNINIEMRDGTILDSNDLYVDKDADIGFIYVDAEELHVTKMLDVSFKVGDTVFHVGTPYIMDFKFSLARGIISFINRDSPIPKWNTLIQTDINGGPGNSGGPLYNLDGILIGVYVGQSNMGGLSISFYIPANQIKAALSRYSAEKFKGDL